MTGLTLALAIGGPLVAAFGALLLAYDLLAGPATWYRREFFGLRSWDILRRDHERTLQRLRALPVPPYTPDQIQILMEEAEARFNALEWEGKEQIRDGTITGLFRSQRLALWGLAFVALGSLCQSLAAWLTAIYSATSAPPG